MQVVKEEVGLEEDEEEKVGGEAFSVVEDQETTS
jgi:hypothetical protein